MDVVVGEALLVVALEEVEAEEGISKIQIDQRVRCVESLDTMPSTASIGMTSHTWEVLLKIARSMI